MRMVDLIEKKKSGLKHSDEEIHFIVDGYVHERIPDYQMSAWMMAVCFQGLDQHETAMLTKEMMYSGDVIDLSEISGVKVDKHSTGGVGDKTSLVLGPMVAACGAYVAKMSGRGLGHTGGTIDKLESIPGFHTQVHESDFIKQVQNCHLAIIGQNQHLVPADQKMYALRDVTGTVDCIALIASSIMSKKLAAGSDTILLDVKYGNGAFMKTKEDAISLAQTMIEIGRSLGKDTRAAISDMSQPLGFAIGNSLEVKEAIATLQGKGPDDLLELCLQSGAQMLMQAKITNSYKEARQMLKDSITSGQALNVLKAMVQYQHGDVQYINDPSLFPQTKEVISIKSLESGYIQHIDAKKLGVVAMKLGGGRQTKDDPIDHAVGLVLHKKVGDYIEKETCFLDVYTNSGLSKELEKDIFDAYTLSDDYVERPQLVEDILI